MLAGNVRRARMACFGKITTGILRFREKLIDFRCLTMNVTRTRIRHCALLYTKAVCKWVGGNFVF